MELTRRWIRPIEAAIVVAAILLATAGGALAQVRVGGTFFPQPADGATRMFPAVAYDSTSNAYLVVWGIGTPSARSAVPIGARFVSADGTPLGSSVAVNTTGVSPQVDGVRVACGPDACLVAWIEEPSGVAGRFVRYNNGDVQFVADQFVISQNGLPKLTSSPPGVAYASASNEFLVAWTEFGPGPDVKAQRVSASGSAAGPEIVIATTSLWEGFPSVTYNSAQNEYMVAYYFETASSSNVATQRVQPGTGALIGGRNTLYGSLFDQYPEIAYNSQQNQYFAITWGFLGSAWMLHGQLADANAEPLGGSVQPLAFKGGGPGTGLAYNPINNSYFCVYQSQTNDEVWGVVVSSNGLPGNQFQVTFSGTRLAVQPEAGASSNSVRWLAVASDSFAQVMGQLVEYDGSSIQPPPAPPPPPPPPAPCTSVQPGPDWTCVNGNWLPPSPGSGGTSGCSTVQPGPDWTCVNGNWLPPGPGSGGTIGCSSVQPGPDWTCVNGNWLPPSPGSGGTIGCSSVQPGPDWTCVNGNWLPPGPGSGGTIGCSTIQPGPGWTCVNGNWLPPGPGSGGTIACSTVQPGPDWICVNGNWLPPGDGGTSSLALGVVGEERDVRDPHPRQAGPAWVPIGSHPSSPSLRASADDPMHTTRGSQPWA